MPKPPGETWNRIMHAIQTHGPMNYLELELRLKMGGLISVISSMKQKGYLDPLPKVRRELKRYDLTPLARAKIGAAIESQEALRYQTSAMRRPEWTPPPEPVGRSGARDAFNVPSLIQGRQVPHRVAP